MRQLDPLKTPLTVGILLAAAFVVGSALVGVGFAWFWNSFLPLGYMEWWEGWLSATILSLVFGGHTA